MPGLLKCPEGGDCSEEGFARKLQFVRQAKIETNQGEINEGVME